MKQKNFGKNLREMKKLPLKHVARLFGLHLHVIHEEVRNHTATFCGFGCIEQQDYGSQLKLERRSFPIRFSWSNPKQSSVQKTTIFSPFIWSQSIFYGVKKKLQPPTDIRSQYLRCMKKRSHQGAGPFSASVKFWTTTATKKQCEKETVASHRIETK